MTVCVGLIHQGAVYLGADSMGSNTISCEIREDRKVFARGDFILAGAGSFRMIQLLRYKFTPPARDPERDVMEYLVTDFIDALRNAYKAAGFSEAHHGVESQNGLFLVGHVGRLFAIPNDFQVAELTIAFNAIGSGGRVAMGALHALQPHVDRLGPAHVIHTAIEAAATYTVSVGGRSHAIAMTWDEQGRGTLIGERDQQSALQ
ncbi:hypothetical protein [Deinococcus soli (ex Cha et al. 2016)]|uniref:ATP-dependent protease HslVU (ClpYQ) peptidase subunit n=2 Tax=Deinococcus soli (ex Cha et al. 2016) TaxID=1309411 RepID=A0ACC6KFJ6_9DEIO|nr:hypothetical protein [Deinococcus soli (ex Cha et al. 2016)]MDR6218231.1 ATP-dependent protease HslVU (ClpYQ) peptidase subunit [Deinococcus soli (ex Cha et al. 2016)]MDR6328971.1 ATP-dependent protease HslVU (ClpYQ) peptidase subunit [Deinococcus soli (ex Cha et al. 2016)]MDR6751244.1 ATP-dependent protease HslVU (ClpYQ) peptidase subunit [Deinococcus soli (ex Cha et al. 2016)]